MYNKLVLRTTTSHILEITMTRPRCSCLSKEPLIPSLLYTEASKKVKCDIEKDMEVPDPDEDEAEAAIAAEVISDEG